MALVTYEQLKAIVNNVVTTSLISNDSFVETRNNLVGLLDKIGKIQECSLGEFSSTSDFEKTKGHAFSLYHRSCHQNVVDD